MLDIHSHILPGIDDGARDIGHSLEMARKYVTAGYTRVIATPHAASEDCGADFARSIELHVANLNAIMKEDHVALTVLPGMEITLAPEVPDMLDKGELIPLAGGSYVLIELPFENHSDRRLIGSAAGTGSPRVDFPWFIELYRQGRLKLDELQSRYRPLDEINEAFEDMLSGEVARTIVRP